MGRFVIILVLLLDSIIDVSNDSEILKRIQNKNESSTNATLNFASEIVSV
jgi:hypothetical protein